MGTFLKAVIYPFVVATFLTACGSGGGSPTPADDSPQPPTLSSDASLSALTMSSGSFNETFSSATYAYSQSTGATETRVTPTLSDANATVTVNGIAVTSGSQSGQIALALGANTIDIVVTAEDGATTQTYTISVSRLSNDASLSAISLSEGALDQVFQPTLYDYTATLGYQQSSVTLTATAVNSAASITVNGTSVASGQSSNAILLVEGANNTTVNVTAEDGVTVQSYTVVITREWADSFAQRAYIKASNTDDSDEFGRAIALSGNTLVVGTMRESSAATGINGDENDNSAPQSGGAYVFARDGSGTWSQQAYIKASNTERGDSFGDAVAISGNTIAVGAYCEYSAATGINTDENDNSAGCAGAVYVFTRDVSGIWSQQAYIKASNTDRDDYFGYSVALSGDTLAVGAIYESSSSTGVNGAQNDNSLSHAGAAYVFTRNSSGIWSQQAYVKASNPSATDRFGWSISLDGDTLAVGAPLEDSTAVGVNGDQTDSPGFNAGAVYVYTRDGSAAWNQQAYIKASNTERDDYFGHSIALSGDTLAVGASQEDSAATGINGNESDNSADQAGAAYVFVRSSSGIWSQQAYIKASNTDGTENNATTFGDQFGWSVALSGDSLAVGAKWERGASLGIDGEQSDNSAPNAGAVYLYARDELGAWAQQAYLKASNTESGDQFGYAVATSADTLAVGAHSEASSAVGVNGDESNNGSPGSGAAYVFQ